MTVKRKWIIAAIALLLMPASAYTYNLLSPIRHWTSDPVICVKTSGHVSILEWRWCRSGVDRRIRR
jgi:hypothetical protein